PLSGSGVAGGAAISPTSLAFSTNCGSTAVPQTFVVTNNGTANMTWSFNVTGTGQAQYGVTAVPPAGTLAPNASSTVTVAPIAIPSPAINPSPTAYAATVVITTDIPNDTAHNIQLSEIPLGDQLSITPSSLDFGLDPINTTTAPQTFTITNNANPGSADANITLTLGGAGVAAYGLTG